MHIEKVANHFPEYRKTHKHRNINNVFSLCFLFLSKQRKEKEKRIKIASNYSDSENGVFNCFYAQR